MSQKEQMQNKQKKPLLILDLVGVVLQVDRNYQLDEKYKTLDRLIGQYPTHQNIFKKHQKALGLKNSDLAKAEDEITRSIVGDEKQIKKFIGLKRYYKIVIYNEGGKLAPNLKNDSLKQWVEKYKLKRITDKIYNSAEIGFAKIDKRGFEFIAKDVGYKLEDIIFVDDCLSVIEQTSKFLPKVILFRPYDSNYNHSYSNLISELENMAKS